MDLKKTIDCLRRAQQGITTCYLVLGLIEIGATDTPFFTGLTDEETIGALLMFLHEKEIEYSRDHLEDYGPDEFLGFLDNEPVLHFNPRDLARLLIEIKTEGEEHYEFKRFSRMDKADREAGDFKGFGP